MTAEEMYALVDYCEDDELPLDFVFDDGYYVYVEYERMARLAVPSVQKFLIDGEDQTRHPRGHALCGVRVRAGRPLRRLF